MTKSTRLAARSGRTLDQAADLEGFSTLDIVNGLRGVCGALDALAGNATDVDGIQDLATASRVLSAMLADRL